MSSPANMTYGSLLDDVRSYVERPNDTNLDNQLPRLVMLAENRLATDLKILGVQAVAASAFEPNNGVVQKPAQWRRNVSMRYVNEAGKTVELLLRTYEFCRQFWPGTNSTPNPRYYADYNFNNLLVAGTPSIGFAFELIYVARLEPLSDASQVNWYTTNAPQLLLNATLLETEIWLKNQSRVSQRAEFYGQSLAAFNSEDGARVLDRSIVRI